MLYHFTYQVRLPGRTVDEFPVAGRVTMHGYLGVNLFFMISGFVIVWTARDRRTSEFVTSRIARLYPEYWISVIISAAAFASVGLSDATFAKIAANLTMVPQLLGQEYVDGVYWTLFVELKFYFLLWLLSVGRQMSRVESWIYLWLAASAYAFLADAPHFLRSATIYPYAPLFIAGCVFFLIRVEGLTIVRAIAILVCLGLASIHVGQMMPGMVRQTDINATTALESRLIIVALFVLFSFIALRKSVVVPLGSFVAQLGMLTYPLYLLHNAGKALFLMPLASSGRYLALACAIVFSLALAALLAIVVERYWRRPFLQALNRFIVRPRPEHTQLRV